MLISTMKVFESLTSELPVGHQTRSEGVCEKRRAAGTVKLHELQVRISYRAVGTDKLHKLHVRMS